VSRLRVRAAVAGLAALATLGVATPALAHTQATIDNPQAGAVNAVLSLDAEAESDTAGIRMLSVTLPTGITPAQVSVVSAPGGWTFTRTTDGFTVAGSALPTHTDAKASLRIAQLPTTASTLAFKTLVTYSDGQVQRWIEVPASGAPEPPDPAPTVGLRPAAATTSAQPVSPGAAVHNASVAANTSTSKTNTTLIWVVVIAALVVLALIALLLWRRMTRLHTND
jgi:Domain of unkown function (DUF1775)